MFGQVSVLRSPYNVIREDAYKSHMSPKKCGFSLQSSVFSYFDILHIIRSTKTTYQRYYGFRLVARVYSS